MLSTIMPLKLSRKTRQEIKRLLPELREVVKKEFVHWDRYQAHDGFYSDENIIEILPYAAYEYILLSWAIEAHTITIQSVVEALNNKLFQDLRRIICHALRRIALLIQHRQPI